MKTKSLCLCAAAVGLATVTLLAGNPPSGRRGTDILHFFARDRAVGEEGYTNVVLYVDARQNQQGNANKQTLYVVLRGLATNESYLLGGRRIDEMNYTLVDEFSPDRRGRAALRYRQLAQGAGMGHGWKLMSAELEPIRELREVAVFNSSTQAVAHVDLSDPEKLVYLVKRDLSTNGMWGYVMIKATTRYARLRLAAYGLSPTNDYILALNGELTQTNHSDLRGRLVMDATLEHPLDVLDLRTVDLWDTMTNRITGTTLP